MDTDPEHGAVALRDLLTLYGNSSELMIQKQIEGVLSINSKAILRRIEGAGPITFGRGIEIAVEFDESLFEGSGVFTLGLVLEHFFAKYASLNSFTETVIKTTDRGEIHRWTLRQGTRPLI
jgi:type VI secretion system protein ImpG